ncbi:MAG TPA: dodecin domain-containing protein [Anaerolineales bacterium]
MAITDTFDDAVCKAVARAVKTLRNVKSASIANQDAWHFSSSPPPSPE